MRYPLGKKARKLGRSIWLNEEQAKLLDRAVQRERPKHSGRLSFSTWAVSHLVEIAKRRARP